MAEQLALEELGRDRRAVDRHERRCRARRPCRWIARATSSLPVPVSPRISTVASLSASRPIAFCTSRIGARWSRPDRRLRSAARRRGGRSRRRAAASGQSARAAPRARSAWRGGRRRPAASPRSCSRCSARRSARPRAAAGSARMRRSTSCRPSPACADPAARRRPGCRPARPGPRRRRRLRAGDVTEIARALRHGVAQRLSSSTIRMVAMAASWGSSSGEDRAPAALPRGVDQPPAMGIGQFPGDGEAEAGAVGTAGDEGLEQALGHSGATPGPLSSTVMVSPARPVRRPAVTAPPGGAWRMALVSRLSRMRPTTVGSSESVPRRHRHSGVSARGGSWSARGLPGEETRQGLPRDRLGSTRCVIASSSPTSASSRSIWASISPIACCRAASSPASAFSPCRRAAAIGLRISCATPAATRPRPASRSARATRAPSRRPPGALRRDGRRRRSGHR